MLTVFSNPTPQAAQADLTNSINQIVWRMERLLPQYGVQLTGDHSAADLFACHAGIGDGHRANVAHISGLYPTHHFPNYEWHWLANQHVIENVRRAERVTVPSQWVAELFARDMHLQTDVVPWGVDTDEWTPPTTRATRPYVLWNKTRVDGICDPAPMNALAKLVPSMNFISTFGQGDHNVHLTGRLLYNQMAEYVQHSAVYLATVLETFGIGTLEAMACGVPVLGFNWGGTKDIVEHGLTGYLVEPGDVEGLAKGLEYCIQHRDTLGANAREVAKNYTWKQTAQQLAEIYLDTHNARKNPRSPKVSVIIPCHNYGRFVGDALQSAMKQETNFDYEIIVVDDASTDNSQEVVLDTMSAADMTNVRYTLTHIFNETNLGVAETRNRGIRESKGQFIICLDADDCLAVPASLQVLSDSFNERPELGIAYGSLRVMTEQGEISPNISAWPSQQNFEQQLQRHNQVPTCCMFRRIAWVRAGGYRARFTPAEDADLWTRIGALGFRASKVTEQTTLIYRMHGNSLSSAVRTGKTKEPDWLQDKKWATDIRLGRPFACDGYPARGSWAVRNYCLPVVSVVIPVAAHHLPMLQQAIDSVESQTYPFWELVIVVDGDEYDHGKILELMDAAPFARFIFTNERKGTGYARNLGAREASARLLVFLDADDSLHTDFITETLKVYRRKGGYVYTDWRSLNKQGQYEDNQCPDYSPQIVFQRTSIHSVTILIEKSAFFSVGGFDTQMIAWEDTDLQMKLAAAGICGSRVPIPLLLYRYTTGQRREVGETVKQQLIDLLHNRYREYIEGRTMCMCMPPTGAQFPSRFGFTVDSNESQASQDSIRIRYEGGHGMHQVIGAATHTDYREHSNGDYFTVYVADAIAQPQLFVVEAELPVSVQDTQAPPPPVRIGARIDEY